jgi:hypothetical protein
MNAAAKGQMLGESVVSLDLGRTLMHGATQGVAHYPFQQVRCAHHFSKFLQGERETIARAVAVDASQTDPGRVASRIFLRAGRHVT